MLVKLVLGLGLRLVLRCLLSDLLFKRVLIMFNEVIRRVLEVIFNLSIVIIF